jgi:cytoskeleton-associated protein 5
VRGGGGKSAAPSSKPVAASANLGENKSAAAGSKIGRVAPKTRNSLATKKGSDEAIGANLCENNLKSQRISDEMKLKMLRWNFTAPREEFIDLLKELMTNAGVGKTLMGNMFHSDFKMHLKALDILQEVSLRFIILTDAFFMTSS